MEIKHLAELGNYSKPRSIPHIDGPGLVQFLTYRRNRRSAVNLSSPLIGKIIQRSWQHFDGERYDLLAWVIMPDHLHLVIEPLNDWSTPSIVKTQKQFSARKINLHLGNQGPVWQKDYWDVVIRNDDDLMRRVRYILENPVRKGLIDDFLDWPLTGCKTSIMNEILNPIGR